MLTHFPQTRRGNFLSCLALAGCILAGRAHGGTISFEGAILQATPDGTGPAVNKPSLNAIFDNDAYSAVLVFGGNITAPGTYNLTGSSFLFSDPAAAASESAFDLISLTVTANGANDDISILGCLTTGSGCFVGNQLTANFRILAASLNSAGVAATGLDQPHPLDLLEDDGITDIHGSVTSYSYTSSVSTAPEPSAGALVIAALAVFALGRTASARRLVTFATKRLEEKQ